VFWRRENCDTFEERYGPKIVVLDMNWSFRLDKMTFLGYGGSSPKKKKKLGDWIDVELLEATFE
jgi:hypothetical protein